MCCAEEYGRSGGRKRRRGEMSDADFVKSVIIGIAIGVFGATILPLIIALIYAWIKGYI